MHERIIIILLVFLVFVAIGGIIYILLPEGDYKKNITEYSYPSQCQYSQKCISVSLSKIRDECKSLCTAIQKSGDDKSKFESLLEYCKAKFTMSNKSEILKINSTYLCSNIIKCYNLPLEDRCRIESLPWQTYIDFSICAEVLSDYLMQTYGENNIETLFEELMKPYACLMNDKSLFEENEVPALQSALQSDEALNFSERYGGINKIVLIGCNYISPLLEIYYEMNDLYPDPESLISSEYSLDEWLKREIVVDEGKFLIIRAPVKPWEWSNCLQIGTDGCHIMFLSGQGNHRLMLTLDRENNMLASCGN